MYFQCHQHFFFFHTYKLSLQSAYKIYKFNILCIVFFFLSSANIKSITRNWILNVHITLLAVFILSSVRKWWSTASNTVRKINFSGCGFIGWSEKSIFQNLFSFFFSLFKWKAFSGNRFTVPKVTIISCWNNVHAREETRKHCKMHCLLNRNYEKMKKIFLSFFFSFSVFLINFHWTVWTLNVFIFPFSIILWVRNQWWKGNMLKVYIRSHIQKWRLFKDYKKTFSSFASSSSLLSVETFFFVYAK